MIDVTLINNSIARIKELSRTVEKLEIEKLAEVNWVKNNCTHPGYTVHRQYNSGGYDYVSSVHITHKCTTCDTVVKDFNDPNHKGSHG